MNTPRHSASGELAEPTSQRTGQHEDECPSVDAEAIPECLSCGVCCFSTLERYVAVSGDDYSRLGDDADRLVQFLGNRAYMRIADGHCAALGVDSGTARFVCSVYERRPNVCRDLTRGGRECAGERAAKGNRPGVLLLSLGRGDPVG